ncbi:MAG: Type IV pilus assembly protein PilM [Candidatus Wolfebacteria bacterium GW2011_GWC2_46_275]|uniref:Type IV pilus assembly protein PilM n=2 Tax=Candidatus Wolfeibacteriota TaxID=1752735 RepID=A0A0G1U8Q8_9BACT|nr:MAG: type IV pilus assembly protein PilM, type IV pilus assembly protein PilM [Candidatus Wolfebacteria bacterium GW2011_GWB1_47_1]KKU37170.1 MAG: Type IV pilus assembly protein PilM [Candidatus Wolfebacteria bacterium GW2011_GWC2_46_275]KKU42670.1 MAG: Type IV pilus assembly protein PilM [Candidatus Wolfebacteria bacterium GW2011_GWB2_46_69]KKU54595.1 MAG: Type IV pilus assembly protein PilM [Candidatus Wolfebacteria bacterium GW2011_GWC1_47_103]KKU59979.1 MAG: Type IV pilus assembly protei
MFGMKLFGSTSYLGVDIGTTSIKIAEIGKGSSGPELQNYGILESYGHLERVNNAIQTSTLKIMEADTIQLLKTLVKRSNFKSREAIVSIPSFAAFITLFEMPQMKDSDISKAMQFQIGQYIPLPITEVSIDWLKVGERQDEQGFIKEQILLVSIPNEVIEKYRRIFSASGLTLRALEIESLALQRSVTDVSMSPTLVVDIGSRSTNIAVIDKGNLRYNYQTDMSGASITQALAGGLGVKIRRAEKLKRERGILGGSESELSTLMMPFVDAILNEAKRAKGKYEQNFGNAVTQVILAGGGSKMPGIAPYAQEQFGLPVTIGDPFSKIHYPPALEPIIRDLGPSFAIAIGLGVKEFSDGSL